MRFQAIVAFLANHFGVSTPKVVVGNPGQGLQGLYLSRNRTGYPTIILRRGEREDMLLHEFTHHLQYESGLLTDSWSSIPDGVHPEVHYHSDAAGFDWLFNRVCYVAGEGVIRYTPSSNPPRPQVPLYW